MNNEEAGHQERVWYRLTGLSTIIMFLLVVGLFMALFPLIFGPAPTL